MWIISKSRLREFWELPGVSAAKGPLLSWHRHVELAEWKNWGDVKADFPSADAVGNCTVFNIGGNKYRLVTRILFVSHKVFILKVMTHQQYDEGRWKNECGCLSPPPRHRPRRRQKRGK